MGNTSRHSARPGVVQVAHEDIMTPFPTELWRMGEFVVTDSMVVTLMLTVLLIAGGRLALAFQRARRTLETLYEVLENAVVDMTTADVRPLVPLILTQWLFLGAANLIGLVPGLISPTRDLSLAAALAAIAFVAGHVHAYRKRGFAYLRQYISPNPLLLPFNVLGEVSRTLALALRLFGNMLSGTLVGAIVIALAGLLIPVPLMLLNVLTAVVQAYIFGVLTLVFAASSLETIDRNRQPKGEKP
jgi:F-type H+-transporting ATPase subunit a